MAKTIDPDDMMKAVKLLLTEQRRETREELDAAMRDVQGAGDGGAYADLLRSSMKSVGTHLHEQKQLMVSVRRSVDTLARNASAPQSRKPELFLKLLATAVRARADRKGLTDYLAHFEGAEPERLRGMIREKDFTFKSTTSPAMTSVAGWAAELTGRRTGAFPIVSPLSAYAQLTARPSVLSLTFDGVNSVSLPARSGAGDLAGAFHAEGEPIPIRKGLLMADTVMPRHVSVISTFTGEMARSSNFEAICRNMIAADTLSVLDAALLSDDAATAITPPGLLADAIPVAPSAASSQLEACAEDLGALASAISDATDLVFVSRPDVKTRALIYGGPGVATLAWITSPEAEEGEIIALDAASLAMAEDKFEFDTSDEAIVVNQDTVPVSPALEAGTQSLWQLDCIGLRMWAQVAWGVRGAGRVAYTESITW